MAIRRVQCSWSQDGRRLAGVIPRPTGQPDVLAVATIENGQARVDVLSEANEYGPQFSPDGHWLAYSSAVSGRSEVYVRPYPGPGPATRVSVEGGSDPAWTQQGRELVFLSPVDAAGKRRMMAADVTPASPPRPGTPRMLFEFDTAALAAGAGACRAYDVTADGQRFLTTQVVPAPKPEPVTHINLIQNWFEELKAKVPAGGAK
jgi:dipeptidyl aminopeptidase/acylaminoacyl peptidase